MYPKIPVGISACLLGDNLCFYDGHKGPEFAVNELAPWVHFEAVYPEKAMQQFTDKHIAGLEHLCGYIACEKPADCDIGCAQPHDAKMKDNCKNVTEGWVAELKRQIPWLPVEECSGLYDPLIRENFVERIYTLFELNNLREVGLTRGGLINFHSRYKLLLLAHSQPHYRELGRFVAEIGNWGSLGAYFIEYRQRLMSLLAHHTTCRNHTNVLMHVQGYFHRYLTSPQRQELSALIDRYRQGSEPLIAPMALLKHYMTEYPDPYLAQQRYFESYPEALALRCVAVLEKQKVQTEGDRFVYPQRTTYR